jgi:O-antigen/teichoic acid export membrane protein
MSPKFAGAKALFMLALLPIPYMQCSFGLAGNIVVMTGHSQLNLLNSTTTALCNTLLNVWLIPLLGPLGAALASAASTLLKTCMQLVEADIVANARLLLRAMYRPHLAGAIAGGGLLLALAVYPSLEATFLLRLGLVAGTLLLYGGALVALTGRLPQMPSALQKPSE